MNRYYVFIDIDGVLNNEQFYKRTKNCTWDLFDPDAVTLLNNLTNKFNAKYVLISFWRKTYGTDTVREIFKKNKIEGKISNSISLVMNKKDGILNWLNKQSKLDTLKFVIIDDQLSLPKSHVLYKHLVTPSSTIGFKIKDYQNACNILNSE